MEVQPPSHLASPFHKRVFENTLLYREKTKLRKKKIVRLSNNAHHSTNITHLFGCEWAVSTYLHTYLFQFTVLCIIDGLSRQKKDDSSAGKKSGWQRGQSIIPHMTFAQFQEISPPHPGHCNIHLIKILDLYS